MTTAALHWRLPVATAAAAGLVALAAMLPAHELPLTRVDLAPAAAVVTGPQLILSGDGAMFRLQADAPVYWQLGVTTRAVSLTALLAAISAGGPLTRPPAGVPPVTLGLAACDSPWQGADCAAGARRLLDATPLGELAGQQSSLADAAGVPAQAYLLATVLMPSAAAGALAGQSSVVTVRVTAQGESPIGPGGTTPTPPGGPGSHGGRATSPGTGGTAPEASGLAYTGTRVGAFALLAAGAVGTGSLLAALARRRNAPQGRS
ncbi:MAG TPA: hypothetical protein VGC45_16330 [Gryllotalpicola sp.]